MKPFLPALVFAVCAASCSDDPVAPTADGGKGPMRDPVTGEVLPPASTDAPVPMLTKLDPPTGALGSAGPAVVVTGTGFVPRSVVNVDGARLDTTFMSATKLVASLPTAKLAAIGDLSITVSTTAPGGGDSSPLKFSVVYPPPDVLLMTPISVLAGSASTKLSIVGTTFVSGTKINFGGNLLDTTVIDSEHLEGKLPDSLIASSASVLVTAVTPGPGGGASGTLGFTIANPLSAVTNVTPASVKIGSPATLITVTGTGFVAGSVIVYNSVLDLATTSAGAGKLTATIPDTSLKTAVAANIAVRNPPPGGGVSQPAAFMVLNPTPTVTSMTPSTIPAGAAATPVTITGTGFVSSSKATFDGTVAPSNMLMGTTTLKTTIPAAKLAAAGTITVKVTTATPPPGGGMSGPLTFTVTPP